jgi:hypothetical protein
MILTKKQQESLRIRLHPSKSLFAENALPEIENILHKILPRWSRKLRARLDTGSKEWFDASKPGTLDGAIRRVIQPGRKYKSLVKRYGPGKYERQLGNVTLTGEYSGVYVFLNLDDWLFAPQQDRQLFGNSISIWIERKEVEGIGAAQWMAGAFAMLCESLDFMFGFAYCNGEYYSKNMNTTHGLSAIGQDPSRYLPGLYWINFFGKPYLELIGKKQLMTTPAALTKDIKNGVLVQFADDPLSWQGQKYVSTINDALDHIGRQYFFDRQNINRFTIAPPFVFESIERDKSKRKLNHQENNSICE